MHFFQFNLNFLFHSFPLNRCIDCNAMHVCWCPGLSISIISMTNSLFNVRSLYLPAVRKASCIEIWGDYTYSIQFAKYGSALQIFQCLFYGATTHGIVSKIVLHRYLSLLSSKSSWIFNIAQFIFEFELTQTNSVPFFHAKSPVR